MEHHFLMHRFGGGLKPVSQQQQQFLIVHQVYWTATPCPCLSITEQESFGGVWSIVSPVKHHPKMFSSGLICRHCNSTIPVETRVEYVEVKATDEQILADLPTDPTIQ